MFCAKCGKRLTAQTRFCPMCGNAIITPIAQTKPIAVASGSKASNPTCAVSAKMKKACQLAGAMDVALVVLLFLPWVNVNLGIWSGSFSLLDFASAGDKVRTMLSYLGSSSSDIAGMQQGLGAFSVVLVVLWLVAAVLLARNAYGNFTGKAPFASGGAATICSMAAAMAAICFFADYVIREGSYGMLSGAVAASPWLWMVLALSLVLLFYSGYQSASFGLKE